MGADSMMRVEFLTVNAPIRRTKVRRRQQRAPMRGDELSRKRKRIGPPTFMQCNARSAGLLQPEPGEGWYQMPSSRRS